MRSGPCPPEESAGELLVVRCDGKGVPMIKEEAVKLKAKLGTGEKRQKKKEALVGSATRLLPSPARPKRWRNSWSIQKRRGGGGSGKGSRTSRPTPSRCVVWTAWCGRSRR